MDNLNTSHRNLAVRDNIDSWWNAQWIESLGVSGGIGRPGQQAFGHGSVPWEKPSQMRYAGRLNPYTGATEGLADRDPKRPEHKRENKKGWVGRATERALRVERSAGRDFANAGRQDEQKSIDRWSCCFFAILSTIKEWVAIQLIHWVMPLNAQCAISPQSTDKTRKVPQTDLKEGDIICVAGTSLGGARGWNRRQCAHQTCQDPGIHLA
ncbi:hypothetical protein B0H17DRAFT_1129352 [Mycena rosella]|uniref:Uncharacterized protein n=1 Tax=Mycena rosella TaxID=1033263 RepID=A0AAD7GPK0_MYCRO|nr:hypothetical protein B0H17DRAFT_1129352 [Mycena rosella]